MVRQRNRVSAAWDYFKPVDGGALCQIEGCTHSFLKRASGSSTKFLWSHLEAHHRELSKELGRLGKKKVRKNQCKKIGSGDEEEINRLSNETLENGLTRHKPLKAKDPYEITNFIAINDEAMLLSIEASKKPLASNSSTTETLDIHCYPSGSSHVTPNFYPQNNIPSTSNNTMNMNLMDLINVPETSNVNNLNSSISESQQPVFTINEYFCKMICAQLSQMSEKQAQMAREKIQSIVGQILFNEQQQQQNQLTSQPPKHLHPNFNQPYS